MQPQTPSRDRFIANRSAIDLDVARYALDSSTNGGNNATNGDGSSASQPDSLLIASPSKVRGEFSRYGNFLLFFYFCRVFRARAMFLSFLPFCVGFLVFFRVVVEEKRSVLFFFFFFFFTKLSFRLMKDLWLVLGEKCSLSANEKKN